MSISFLAELTTATIRILVRNFLFKKKINDNLLLCVIGKWRLYRVDAQFPFDGSKKLTKSDFQVILEIDLLVENILERYSCTEQSDVSKGHMLLQVNPFHNSVLSNNSFTFLKSNIVFQKENEEMFIFNLKLRIARYKTYLENRNVQSQLNSLDISANPKQRTEQQQNSRIPYILDPNLIAQLHAETILQFVKYVFHLSSNADANFAKNSQPFQINDIDFYKLSDSREALAKFLSDAILKMKKFGDYNEFIDKLTIALKQTRLDRTKFINLDFEYNQSNYITDDSHPYNLLLKLLRLEYDVKYVPTKKRLFDYIYRSNDDVLNRNFKFCKLDNLLNQCFRQNQLKNVEFHDRDPIDMSINLYADVRKAAFKKIDVFVQNSDNEKELFKTMKKINRDLKIGINEWIAYFKSQKKFHNDDIEFKIVEDNPNMLLLTCLNTQTGSGLFEIYQDIVPSNIQYSNVEKNLSSSVDNAAKIENVKKRKFYVSCLYQRAEIILNVYSNETIEINYDKLQKTPAMKQLMSVAGNVENKKILINSSPSFTRSLRLPVFVSHLKKRSLPLETNDISWVFFPRMTFDDLNQYLQKNNNLDDILNDKKRYCNRSDSVFKSLWEQSLNIFEPQQIFNDSRQEKDKDYLFYTLGLTESQMYKIQKNNYRQFLNSLAQSSSASQSSLISSGSSNSGNGNETIDSTKIYEEFLDAPPVINSMLNGIYFCIESGEKKENVIGLFQVNIESTFEKHCFFNDLPSKLSIETIYNASSNLNIHPIIRIEWLKSSLNSTNNGNNQLQTLMYSFTNQNMANPQTDSLSQIITSNRNFVKQKGFLFFPQPKEADNSRYTCKLIVQPFTYIIDTTQLKLQKTPIEVLFYFDVQVIGDDESDENYDVDLQKCNQTCEKLCKKCFAKNTLNNENSNCLLKSTEQCCWKYVNNQTSAGDHWLDIGKFLTETAQTKILKTIPLFLLDKEFQMAHSFERGNNRLASTVMNSEKLLLQQKFFVNVLKSRFIDIYNLMHINIPLSDVNHSTLETYIRKQMKLADLIEAVQKNRKNNVNCNSTEDKYKNDILFINLHESISVHQSQKERQNLQKVVFISQEHQIQCNSNTGCIKKQPVFIDW